MAKHVLMESEKAAITFDPAKNDLNREKHGLGFDDFKGFDNDPIVTVDGRAAYGEVRYRAFGRIGQQGYMIAFTARAGMTRLISFRRAHEKEMRRHEQ